MLQHSIQAKLKYIMQADLSAPRYLTDMHDIKSAYKCVRQLLQLPLLILPAAWQNVRLAHLKQD